MPSSQPMGSITYMPYSGYEENIQEQPPTGNTYTEDKIDQQGIITVTIIAPSIDSKCSVTLDEGIKALDKYGKPLTRIRIVELKDPPAPSKNCSVITLVYDIRSNGATFEPPVILTINYDESQIPDGISEEKLVISTWDEVTEE